MFNYLEPYNGPVVDGLERFEQVYAENQHEYIALRTLPAEMNQQGDPMSAISRWTPSEQQREAIAYGADILLEVTHFGKPLAPVRMMVTDQAGEHFAEWFSQHTRAPFCGEIMGEQAQQQAQIEAQISADILDKARQWIDEWKLRNKIPTTQRKIDGKFSTDGTRIFNTVSGQDIPEDEPLFVLRARDHHALAAINAYQEACEDDCNDLHRAGIQQVRESFCRFAAEHPDRMKQPGITRHLKLEAD